MNFCGDSLDVVLQIIKSQIKLIVLIARVDIFFLIVRIFLLINLIVLLTALNNYSRKMLHGWKEDSMLVKDIAAYTHLSSTVYDL